MEPRLFAHPPRAADLRVIGSLVVLTKGAVVVAAKSRCHEETVLPSHLLLHVHAHRGVGEIRLGATGRRAATDRRDRSRGERRSRRLNRARLSAVVLQSK